MRMRPDLVAGVAAAALALTACGVAAGTSGGTPRGSAPVSARHAQTDTWYPEMKDLAQVKRDAAGRAVDPAGPRQPQADASSFAERRDLAQVKRGMWKAAGLARSG